jgi:hypothetical protein
MPGNTTLTSGQLATTGGVNSTDPRVIAYWQELTNSGKGNGEADSIYKDVDRYNSALAMGFDVSDSLQRAAFENGGIQGLITLGVGSASGNNLYASQLGLTGGIDKSAVDASLSNIGAASAAGKYDVEYGDALRDTWLYNNALLGTPYQWTQQASLGASSPVLMQSQQTTGGAVDSSQYIPTLTKKSNGEYVSDYGRMDSANAIAPNGSQSVSGGAGGSYLGGEALSASARAEARKLGIPQEEWPFWSEDDIHAAYLDPRIAEYFKTSKRLFANGANVTGQQLGKDARLAFLLANNLTGTSSGTTPFYEGKADWISNPYEELGYNLAQRAAAGPGRPESSVGASYLLGARGINTGADDLAYMNSQLAKSGGIPIEADPNKTYYGSDYARFQRVS